MENALKRKRRKPSVWKGAAAGAVGGLVASWAMNEFSALVKTVAKSGSNAHKGLSKKPTEYPLSRHLSGLGQHLVYGATVELVRRGMRERF